jgi:hypothetical protein
MKQWIGQTIEVYFDPDVKHGKDKKGGARIRIPKTEPDPTVT